MTMRSRQPRCGIEQRPLAIAALLVVSTLAACARHTARPPAPPRAVQEGIASWYGPGFHGKPTTSGEVYDQNDMTAAHPSLPLGTRVAVTNLDNGRSVEVRVNDRGPFAKSRVIDVSYAAARMIDIVGPGTARVRVEPIDAPDVNFEALVYTVQVGSFLDRRRAEEMQRRLQERFGHVYVTGYDGEVETYYRVRVGRFAERADAVGLAREMVVQGLTPVVMEAESAR